MTVLVEIPKVSHVTDAVQVDFAFTFKVFTETAVQVYLNDNNTPEDPSSYSVVLVGDPLGQIGGTVTMNAAPAAGTLTIIRATAQSQNTDYSPFDSFPAETHETGLDKAMMVAQEGSEISARAIVTPPGTDPTVDYTAPGYNAGKGWMWSESDPKQIVLSNENFNQIVTLATDQAAAASVSASNAASSESRAQEWAENPVDDPVTTGKFSALHWAQKAEDAAGLTFPVGLIIPFPLTPTAGFLECDGSAVDRIVFASLFEYLGVAYGNGDGVNTFNLPDYRGKFLRGQDQGAGIDPDAAGRTDRGDGTTGDNPGTKQADALQDHTHTAIVTGTGNYQAVAGTIVNGQTTGANGARVAVETRAINDYVVYGISTGEATKPPAVEVIPPGSTQMWWTAVAPTGWLLCDGASILTASFADLFAVLGYTYGGAGANFNLPDTRGEFIRGADNAAGNDPNAGTRTDRGDGTTGDNVGTKQLDLFKSHTHGMYDNTFDPQAGGANNAPTQLGASQVSQATGGSETRGRNIAANHIIKF